MAKAFLPTQKSRRLKNEKVRNVKNNLLISFLFGIMRGFGMALGFSGLAVIVLYITKLIPIQKIPFISDLIDAIINASNNPPK